eukprot:1154088-Pelagomonas_calceolata.AAC.10
MTLAVSVLAGTVCLSRASESKDSPSVLPPGLRQMQAYKNPGSLGNDWQKHFTIIPRELISDVLQF